jgi:hypothetical protein
VKKVLNIIKANLLVFIVMVVTLLALPAMIFFSTKWGTEIRKEVEKRESSNIKAIDALTVNYEVPAVIPGEEAISVRTTPNKATTDKVAELRRRIFEQSQGVRDEAVAHNSSGKVLLIDGPTAAERLFPEPANESARTHLRSDMVGLWPRAHDQLVEDARWGTPPEASAILADLQRFQNEEVKRIVSNREAQGLTEGEDAELLAKLSDRRLDLYRGSASRFSAYAEPGVFAGVFEWPDGDLPELDQLWEWQFLYWMHEDIVRAIGAANADKNDDWLPVYRAPIRHVLSVVVEPWMYSPGQGEPVGEINDKDQLAPDYSRSHSGRTSWPNSPNPFYDLRYAEVDLIAASDQLPEILRAFRSTNLMTVTDFDVDEFDPAPALEQGYYYGGSHLVRVHLRIEAIWLRQWMKPLMPASVREAMGIPADPDEIDENSELSE